MNPLFQEIKFKQQNYVKHIRSNLSKEQLKVVNRVIVDKIAENYYAHRLSSECGKEIPVSFLAYCIIVTAM